MRYFTAGIFLLLWTLLMGWSWAEPPTLGANPMERYSTNPTMPEIAAQINRLRQVRPDLSPKDLIIEAIRRAYILKNGEEI